MCPFLGQMTQQVRALAFNSIESILAVGYGNTVALFSRSFTDGASTWNHIETIKGPCNNRSGLVNALIFYPVPEGGRHLLIAYAEWGWRYVNTQLWKILTNQPLVFGQILMKSSGQRRLQITMYAVCR